MILEALLLTLLLLLLGVASYTDCRVGQIRNRHLGCAVVPILLLDAAYYLGETGAAYGQVFFVNVFCLALTGLLLYGLHVWAAGDTKLLVLVALSIPGRLYAWQLPYVGSGVLIVAFAFVAAFVYVLLSGLRKRLHESHWPQVRAVRKLDWLCITASYIWMVTWVQFVLAVCYALRLMAASDRLLDAAASCALVLLFLSIREHMTTKQISKGAALGCLALLAGSFSPLLSFSYALSAVILLWAVLLMLLRLLVQDYNYVTIPTQEVRAGQILAAATVCRFSRSRVRNLPEGLTEDLASRLTAAEAASVRRWQYSKYGEDTVVIVRKIPFAIFLAIGTMAFLVLEVVGL